MKEIYYKVTLLSDVVLNSTLATEGNMTTLDYIPGSNFLGMVAGKFYDNIDAEKAFNIFHSGKVRFGEATISLNEKLSYSIPNQFYTDKLKKELTQDPIYIDYLIDRANPPKDEQGKQLQLKQVRSGYFLSDFTLIKEIEKSFAIKSAQDRKTRTSLDGAMFGFESLNKGLEFIFSVQFDDDTLFDDVNTALQGTHRLGKSKNAEFGQIKIDKIKQAPETIKSFDLENRVLVYAQSNLCFLDNFGMPTFQPTAEQLGLSSGNIDYTRSQIRTHIYSPWNFKRKATNTQRNCITKGSVFVVDGVEKTTDSSVVGLHSAEGFGRVLYNPAFLKGDKDAKVSFNFIELSKRPKSDVKTPSGSSSLIKFLSAKISEKASEKAISDAVQRLVYLNTQEIQNLKKITSSQWGGIRAIATKETDMQKLSLKLFGKSNLADANEKRDEKFGYLTHGVADEKYWGKNRAANRIALENIFTTNLKFGSQFIAKFAAEMAKENRKLDKSKKHE
jgi:hypothetical protein